MQLYVRHNGEYVPVEVVRVTDRDTGAVVARAELRYRRQRPWRVQVYSAGRWHDHLTVLNEYEAKFLYENERDAHPHCNFRVAGPYE